CISCLLSHRLRSSTLFPYTTLFRSFEACLSFAIAREAEYLAGSCRDAGIARRFRGRAGIDQVYRERGARHREVKLNQFPHVRGIDRKSTRLNSSHVAISYAVVCLKK